MIPKQNPVNPAPLMSPNCLPVKPNLGSPVGENPAPNGETDAGSENRHESTPKQASRIWESRFVADSVAAQSKVLRNDCSVLVSKLQHSRDPLKCAILRFCASCSGLPLPEKGPKVRVYAGWPGTGRNKLRRTTAVAGYRTPGSRFVEASSLTLTAITGLLCLAIALYSSEIPNCTAPFVAALLSGHPRDTAPARPLAWKFSGGYQIH